MFGWFVMISVPKPQATYSQILIIWTLENSNYSQVKASKWGFSSISYENTKSFNLTQRLWSLDPKVDILNQKWILKKLVSLKIFNLQNKQVVLVNLGSYQDSPLTVYYIYFSLPTTKKGEKLLSTMHYF